MPYLPTITAAYVSQITIVETSTDPYVSPADATITYDGLNTTETDDAATTPPATAHAVFSQALLAGVATINFRTLPGPHGQVLDMNGKKLQMFKFINSVENNPITISPGAEDGYDFMGPAGLVVLGPGDEISARFVDNRDDVDNTHKTIDLAGSTTEALTVQLVFG